MRSLRYGTALLAVILATAATGVGRAEDKKEPKTEPKAEPKMEALAKVETKALDLAVKKALREVINRGADVYNAPTSDYTGCYHLYEGALLAVRPLLDGRPALQKEISEGLVMADREANVTQKAYVLRRILDKVRDEVDPDSAPPKVVKSLWDRLGGEKGVSKVVDDFVAAAATDTKVNFFRKPDVHPTPDQVIALKKSLVAFFSMATGGPIPYTGKSMKDAHKGMHITDAEFDALAGDLKVALEKNGVKPDDVKLVMGAVGGTRKDIVEGAAPPLPIPTTLWDRLGGEKGVSKVVDDFVAAAAPDPKVNFFRKPDAKPTPEQVAALKKSIVAFVSMATGGPIKYTGKSMKEAHKGMMITDAEFDALAGHLKNALENNGVKPDDVKAVMGAVGGTRKDIVEPAAPPPPPTPATLWERLGGEKGVTKVIDDFVAGTAPDPKVNFFRKPDAKPTPEQVAALKKSLVAFVSMASGGPIKYTGKSMKEAHKGMMITDAEFDALAGHLKTALENNGVKPDDIKAVMDAVGGTRKDIVEKKE